MRCMVSLPNDPVKIHLDAWAIKKLYSLGLRRSGSDKSLEHVPMRKDSLVVLGFVVVCLHLCNIYIMYIYIYTCVECCTHRYKYRTHCVTV